MFIILTKGVKDKRTIVIFALIIKRALQNFILYDHFYSHAILHKVRNECVGKKMFHFMSFLGNEKSDATTHMPECLNQKRTVVLNVSQDEKT